VSKRIYLIRHGQSEANAEGRIQGWFDSPLNGLGRRQAHCLARRLSTESPFFAIFSSPLRRAAETAEIIADHLNCPINFENDLREYNMGPITGLTLQEVKEQFPGRYLTFKHNKRSPHLPGEEGEDAFLERVRQCMDKILQQIPDDQSVQIISHSGTLNACLRNWLGLTNNSRRLFSFHNASITVVKANALDKRIIYANDTYHLGTLKRTGGISE
jgi:broad specificity phosphatase PhoE